MTIRKSSRGWARTSALVEDPGTYPLARSKGSPFQAVRAQYFGFLCLRDLRDDVDIYWARTARELLN